MSEVPRHLADQVKREVERLARGVWRDLRLEVRQEGSQQVAYTPDGKRFGVLSCDSPTSCGQTITIRGAFVHDGNLCVVVGGEITSADGREHLS